MKRKIFLIQTTILSLIIFLLTGSTACRSKKYQTKYGTPIQENYDKPVTKYGVPNTIHYNN